MTHNHLAVVFPGQGSQFVGMGRELFDEFEEARRVFDEAESILGFDIARLCFEGPADELDLTVNTQISVLTLGIAAFRVFEGAIGIKPVVMAGHSLGEYAALTAAGAIAYADVLPLVHARAHYQQEAVPLGRGCMAAIIGMNTRDIEEVCRYISGTGQTVEPANFNGPGQTVISGTTEGVEAAMTLAKDRGARRAVKLPISVPCHCGLLENAARRLEETLATVALHDCSIPVIPNYDPEIVHSRVTTRDLLVRQLYHPVKWQQTVEKMIGMGIDTIIEVGPKKTLTALIKRTAPEIRLLNIDSGNSLAEAIHYLGMG